MRLQVHVVPAGSPATAPAVCSFLEIASPTLTLEALCISISDRFERLYPHRPPLKIDKIQDSNGNDLDLGYLVSDVFSDKLEDNLNSIVRVLQKSTSRESSIPPESSLRPQFARKRRRLGTVIEVSSNTSQEPAPSTHSSERGRIRERLLKRPRTNDYVVQDSMDDREEGEERWRWRQRTGHCGRSDIGHNGSGMVEVTATQKSGQLSPSLGNRTPSPEIAITGTVEHPGQVPFAEVKVEDKGQAEEIQEIHYSSPHLPQETGSAELDHHSSPALPPNPTQNVDIVANGIRRSIYDILTSSSSEDEPSLPVSSQNKRRHRNGNPSQSPMLRKKRAEEARLAVERAEGERAREQAAAREKAAEACEKAEKAEKERLAKEKAEAERREKERKETELQEQKRIAAEKLEKQRREEERKRKEKAQQEARIAAEKAEKEKLERLENEKLTKEKAEQERLAEEKREQARIVKEKAEQEKAERERLEKERIQREKEEALSEKREKARKQKLTRAAEKRAQAAKERAEKLEREKAENAEKLEREKTEKAERLDREKAEKAGRVERVAREKSEKVEKLEREKAEKARKQAEEDNPLAKEAVRQALERAKVLALNYSGKEMPSSQLLPQSSQFLVTDSESPAPTPNSTLKRSNLKTKILEGSRKRSSVSFAEDLTEVSSPTPTGKKDTLAPVLGSKVTPILPPGYGANKTVAEAVVMKAPAKPVVEVQPPTKRTKLAVLPPKPTAKKSSPQPSIVPAQASSQRQKAKEPAPKSKPTSESDSESESSADEDSEESGSGESGEEEEEEEAKPSSKLLVVKKSIARVKSAKNASPLVTLKPSSSTAANSLSTPPSTQQSSQPSSHPTPQLPRKTPISAPATLAVETDSEVSSEEGIGSASDSDLDPAPRTTPPTASTRTSKPKTTIAAKRHPQPYKSLTDLEKMPVPDVHDIHSSQAPLNSFAFPALSGTVRKTHDEDDDDSSEESSESGESSGDEGEVAGKQVINSARKAASAPAKRGGFLSNFWGRKEK